MKTAFALFFSLVVCSAAFGWGSPQPKPEPIELPSEPQIFIPQTDPGHTFTQGHLTGTVSQVARLTRLVEQVEVVINSEDFKKRVLNAWYKGKAQFVDSPYSNEQVFRILREGAELKTVSDWTWNLEIEVEKSRCSTLGWTYPSVKKFWINSCNFEKRKDSGLAGTICHEYAHKLGFSHSYKWTASREYSVPYAVGTICAEIYNDLFNQSASSQP